MNQSVLCSKGLNLQALSLSQATSEVIEKVRRAEKVIVWWHRLALTPTTDIQQQEPADQPHHEGERCLIQSMRSSIADGTPVDPPARRY